jgi:hypothetical protein
VGTLEPIRRRAERCLEVVQDKGSVEPERLACASQGRPGPPGLGERPGLWMTEISELDTLFEATSDEVDRTRGVLADIPVIVLTAAKSDGPSPTLEDAGSLAWQHLHHLLAEGFRRSDQRLVKSSHLMMNDRPDVVAGAAIELVEAARKR